MDVNTIKGADGISSDRASGNEIIMDVKNLTKYFPVNSSLINFRKDRKIKAVDDVSFSLMKGETLALVGESGCGKSTLGRVLLRLLEPTSGHVIFEGQDIFSLGREAMREMRRKLQIVFQDPYSSLNPRMTVEEIVGEPLANFNIASGAEKAKRVRKMLEVTGLASYHARRYPHEFSGGQRQRIGIARALILNPKILVCDEAVSALDVSVQAQVINLMQDLQEEFGLTYLFIAHDLSVVKHISDRVGVMYLGKVVEIAEKSDLYNNPMHPYTKALLSAIPVHDPLLKKDRTILEGTVPSPQNPPSGCNFHTRCPLAKSGNKIETCKRDVPVLRPVGDEHYASCHFV